MKDSSNSRYLTREEAARYARISLSVLGRWIAAGLLPRIKAGRRTVIDVKDLDEVLASHKATAPSQPESS